MTTVASATQPTGAGKKKGGGAKAALASAVSVPVPVPPAGTTLGPQGAAASYSDDDDDTGTTNTNTGTSTANGTAPAPSPTHVPQPGDDADSDDNDDPASGTGSKSKKKKKKKKGANSSSSIAAPGTVATTASGGANNKASKDVWYKSPTDERHRIREYWLGLTEDERRKLVRLEKESVLKKMKEQGRHTCQCAVCGRKRWVGNARSLGKSPSSLIARTNNPQTRD